MLREQDAEDRRVARLTISADAARRFAEWRSARAHLLEDALAQLEEADRRSLVEAMPALRAVIERLSSQAP